jgi:hypothetical protein
LPEVTYTRHLRRRLELRGFPEELPRAIFREPDRRYRDTETGHLIAVKRVRLRRRQRLVLIAYDQLEHGVEIVTIHPLSEQQEASRIKMGRWIRIG